MRLTATADLTGFHEGMRRMRHELRAIQRDSVQRAGEIAVAYAQGQGRFRDRTGTLRKRINRSNVRFDGNEAYVWFVAPVEYASFVEYGTKPHDIWPKQGFNTKSPLHKGQSRRARTDIGTHRVALRWYEGGDTGRPIFARMVHHPGGHPYPFMIPAAKAAESWLMTELERRFLGLQRLWT